MFSIKTYSIQDCIRYIDSTTITSSSSKITISKIADYTSDFQLTAVYKRTVSNNNGTGIGVSNQLVDNATAPSNISDIYLGGWASTKGLGINTNGTWNGNNRTSGALTQNTEYLLDFKVQSGSVITTITQVSNSSQVYTKTLTLPYSITNFYIAFIVTDSTVQYTDVKLKPL